MVLIRPLTAWSVFTPSRLRMNDMRKAPLLVHPASRCKFSLSWAFVVEARLSGGRSMTLRVRDLHEGEAEELVRITRSRTLGAGLVRRAQIVQHAVDGLSAPEIAACLDVCKATVRFWLKRFNARGLPGLKEEM